MRQKASHKGRQQNECSAERQHPWINVFVQRHSRETSKHRRASALTHLVGFWILLPVRIFSWHQHAHGARQLTGVCHTVPCYTMWYSHVEFNKRECPSTTDGFSLNSSISTYVSLTVWNVQTMTPYTCNLNFVLYIAKCMLVVTNCFMQDRIYRIVHVFALSGKESSGLAKAY